MTPLAFQRRPIPAEDELLSSYLVRLAAALGISPHRLCAELGGGGEIWTRDVDRTASSKLINAIMRYCDRNYDDVQAMTLCSLETVLSGFGLTSRQGIAAWINALGIFHRTRRHHGLQYCPMCLDETPIFKRVWRLSFVTVCTKHQLALRDSCPRCDAPVIPHRSLQAGLRCHTCCRHLIGGSPIVRCDLSERIALQKLFLETSATPEAQLGCSAVPAEAFFRGATQVLQVAKSKMTQVDCNEKTERGQFELLRTDVRAKYVPILFQLLSEWPHRFVEFAERHSVSQTCFAKYGSLPDWVGNVVRNLPARIRQSRKKTAFSAPMKRKDHEPERWRTLRARVLLRAAGGKP